MKQKSKITGLVCATGLFAAGLFSQNAQAIPIYGSIDFNGAITTNTGNVNTASVINAFSGVTVSDAVDPTGSYAPVTPGTNVAVSMPNTVTLNPLGGTASPLWTFTYSGVTYTFKLTGVTFVDQSFTNFLNVDGTGVASISGGVYDPTPGVWHLTATQSSSGSVTKKFSFSSSSTVPDGGSTVAFLGLALVGVEGLRRKLRMA